MTVQTHRNALHPKRVPPRAPKWESAVQAGGAVAPRENCHWTPLGDVFVWGIVHCGKAVSWQALSKVTKVTLLFQKGFCTRRCTRDCAGYSGL